MKDIVRCMLGKQKVLVIVSEPVQEGLQILVLQRELNPKASAAGESFGGRPGPSGISG